MDGSLMNIKNAKSTSRKAKADNILYFNLKRVASWMSFTTIQMRLINLCTALPVGYELTGSQIPITPPSG
ncbi:Hypothetical predicted protein [Cloeon dipterum]|uniref:Uncharacterized protein n=1 Tax=Cloeon dipterum TaxID=197152 RepID=A0A8S1D9R5_9INSE|nr:Hypothetical predicted protein [Cloeon dipterum]